MICDVIFSRSARTLDRFISPSRCHVSINWSRVIVCSCCSSNGGHRHRTRIRTFFPVSSSRRESDIRSRTVVRRPRRDGRARRLCRTSSVTWSVRRRWRSGSNAGQGQEKNAGETSQYRRCELSLEQPGIVLLSCQPAVYFIGFSVLFRTVIFYLHESSFLSNIIRRYILDISIVCVACDLKASRAVSLDRDARLSYDVEYRFVRSE